LALSLYWNKYYGGLKIFTDFKGGFMSKSVMKLGVAVYLPEQWGQFLASSEDRDELEATWEEWHENLQMRKDELKSQGIELIDVVVDIRELMQYCREKKLPNTGQTRADYVSDKMREMFG
jgi:hypothetical protein